MSKQKEAASTLAVLTSVLEAKAPIEPDYKTLVRGADGLIGGIGNVLRISSFNAKFHEEQTLSESVLKNDDEFINSFKKISRDLINASDRVGDVVLARIVVGEKPSILKGDSLALLLSREVPEVLAGSRLVNMGASFTFPKDAGVFGKDTTAVSSQVR
jgi:hypothetical protein